MDHIRQDALQGIGNTSLVALRKIGAELGTRILLKLENENPTGSMKDRMALAMIEAAESDGRLKPGGSVVEYTGGSTGVSLSFICSLKGYPLRIVTSDAFTREKLDHMEILGARLEIVKSDAGRMTEKLTRDMIEAAAILGDGDTARSRGGSVRRHIDGSQRRRRPEACRASGARCGHRHGDVRHRAQVPQQSFLSGVHDFSAVKSACGSGE